MSAISQLGVGSIPRWANWEYANAAARTGASGFVATDVGKIAKQTDNGTFWELTAVTPAWAQVGGGSNLQLDITVNAEDADSVQIDVQVQDSSGNNLAAIYSFDVWVSENASDGTIAGTAPNDGFTVGSPGAAVITYTADLAKRIVTDSSGQVSIFLGETGAAVFYLVFAMPDGTITISDAITFTV